MPLSKLSAARPIFLGGENRPFPPGKVWAGDGDVKRGAKVGRVRLLNPPNVLTYVETPARQGAGGRFRHSPPVPPVPDTRIRHIASHAPAASRWAIRRRPITRRPSRHKPRIVRTPTILDPFHRWTSLSNEKYTKNARKPATSASR
jgi:hypothetical protein